MAKFNSKDSIFRIEDASAHPGTERDLSQYIDEVDGLPGEAELNEVTALGDDGQKDIRGIERVTFSIAGHFDTTATSGPDVVLEGLRTDDNNKTFKYGPHGDASSDTRYTAVCKLRTYTITSRVGNVVRWRAEFNVQGTVTRDTF